MKPLFRTALIVIALLFPLHAMAVTAKDASNFATQIGNDALQVLSASASDATKQRELEALFARNVDTDWIAQFVLGRSWRELNDVKKQEYLTSYRTFLIKHYTSNFKKYTQGTDFKVTGTRELKPGVYLVTMTIKRAGEPDVLANYRIADRNGALKVTDIIVEGVSLLTTQRSEFQSVVSRKGIDHLIAQLKKRAADAQVAKS